MSENLNLLLDEMMPECDEDRFYNDLINEAHENMWEKGMTLNEAINASKILNQTDAGRLYRAKIHVKVTSPLLTKFSNGFALEANVKSFPSSENKRHWLYIVHDPNTRDIIEMFCGCRDWLYRQYWVNKKYGLARWYTDPKFPLQKYKKNMSVFPKDLPPVKVNPTNKLYLCKHLSAVILQGYL